MRDYSLTDGNKEHLNTTKPEFRSIKGPLESGLLFIIEQPVESWKSNSHNKNLKPEHQKKLKKMVQKIALLMAVGACVLFAVALAQPGFREDHDHRHGPHRHGPGGPRGRRGRKSFLKSKLSIKT